MRDFRLRSLSLLLAVAAGLMVVATAFAQTPTPEQLDLLNALPPAQREAILREIRQRDQQAQQSSDDTEAEEAALEALLPEASLEEEEEDGEEARLAANDVIVVEFSLREDDVLTLPVEEFELLGTFRERLAAGNPYSLDGQGYLYLPGVDAIALAGLNVDEAAVRLRAETALVEFQLFVTLLPLEPTGLDALEPFGYSLFEEDPRASLAPATDLPVPGEYVLGPGDSMNVQFFGSENAEYILEISREGTISFPNIGPIAVGGLSFADARAVVTERVTEQMIGVRVSVSLGELRSVRVFVLGDVERPGSYTVGGLSTITNALFVSGGVKPIGSLRNIELKRNGETISTLDLYDLLLRGDNSGDARLQAGDVVFVPTVGATVSIDGEIRRPGIYETISGESLSETIALAGGVTAMGDSTQVKFERIVAGRGVEVSDVNLAAVDADTAMQDGDIIRVVSDLGQLASGVRLLGNAYQTGNFQWYPGMRLTDLIPVADVLKPKSDLRYVLIRREIVPNVFIEALSADLEAAWRAPDSVEDIPLAPRDSVYVFNLDVGREHVVGPLLDELRVQSPANQAVAVVRIGGRVRAPGDYPLEPGMQINDLIRAGGGLDESAYTIDAELTRYEIVAGASRETGLLTVDLAAVLVGSQGANLNLTAHDYLNIKEVPRWREQQTVELLGEVVFPGVYPIRQGESLTSVLNRAGGLTDLAFAEGSIFLREELAELENEQLEVLAARVESDLAALSLSDPDSTEAISTGQSLITQLRNAEPTGRLVIRLEEIVANASTSDILLKDGDRLLVPDATQAVTVLGEVQYATSHIYETTLGRDEYVQRSGGLTRKADDNRIYVVRASGAVSVASGSRWFARRRASDDDIRPGDTIVVPLDTDRVRPLVLWTGVTSVIYNLAIAVSAINSF